MKPHQPPKTKSQLAVLSALSLSLVVAACGGGGGSAGSAAGATQLKATTLTGAAKDNPIAGAVITITTGAPLNDAGASTAGTITADSSGAFTVNVPLPTTSVPVFANATDPSNSFVILSSYLGQSDKLGTAGTLTTANLPDLEISPVTTAALAVYAQLNGNSYATLTPTTYASTLQTYWNDILAISAAIKAVGDNLCTPGTTLTTSTNLAANIAAGSNLSSGSSTTLQTAATALGGNCPTVLATLPMQIAADPDFGPELHVGDVIDANLVSVPAGTYQLQGVIAETGMMAPASGSITVSTLTFVPASIFVDAAITIDSTGAVTSTDKQVSGTLVGNLLTLNVTNGTGTGAPAYTLRGKIGQIPSALTTGGNAYAIQSGGTNNATQVLTNFEAVLAPAAVSPSWTGIASLPAASSHGVSCAAGSTPLRLDTFGTTLGGGSIGECITPTATGWTMAAPTSGAAYYFDDSQASSSTATPPTLTAPTWSEVTGATAAPFIISDSSATYTQNGTPVTGTTYYVLGTRLVIFASASANNVLAMHESALGHMAEGEAHAMPGASMEGSGSQDH
ncbi:MAG: hypothetical protein KGM40_00530 [Betaproteobacteria bacterium]|nr:hypothetical protein [Betaproteobacteria bacterium]